MTHNPTGIHWGNVIVIGIAGLLTIVCFVMMCWMLIRPGERDRLHPKRQILSKDR